MRTVQFVAQAGGDGECFLWRGATELDRAAVVGTEQQAQDRKDEEEFAAEMTKDLPHLENHYNQEWIENRLKQIYPGDVCRACGVQDGKFYLFTVTVEEIPG